jgi:hypothetical protein
VYDSHGEDMSKRVVVVVVCSVVAAGRGEAA